MECVTVAEVLLVLLAYCRYTRYMQVYRSRLVCLALHQQGVGTMVWKLQQL